MPLRDSLHVGAVALSHLRLSRTLAVLSEPGLEAMSDGRVHMFVRGGASVKYRPEIDGLRCVAVLPVLLFHAGFAGFSGGFIGVDVFFVISGFLISSIILREVSEGRFSFANFYERRVRRILPALAVVVLASLLLVLALGLPRHVEEAAHSGLFALLGVSNIYFWTQSGYFAPASEFQVLLHTWSLGVEEQFYVFLPPLLLLFTRFRANLKLWVGLALPIIFAAAWWLSLAKPSVAFYLLPARAWELGLGLALAVGLVPAIRSPRMASAVAMLGLLAILGSVVLIDKTMAFPGWVALFPCLGTAAVIHAASPANLAGRLLSVGWVRFVGVISYSLYLWHWPVLVGLRMLTAKAHLDPLVGAAGLVLSFGLAVLSWKFVEMPFRSPRTMRFRRVGLALGGLAAACVALSAAGIVGKGLPGRLDTPAQTFLAAAEDVDGFGRACAGRTALTGNDCTIGNPDGRPDFVLIGDSHAAALRPALERWADAQARTGTLLWRGGCPTLPGLALTPDHDADQCAAFKAEMFDNVLRSDHIDTVFMGGRWEFALTGTLPESGGSLRHFWVEGPHTPHTRGISNALLEASLRDVAARLTAKGKTVVFIGAVPEAGFDVPEILALAARNRGVSTRDDLAIPQNSRVARDLDAMFARITSAVPGTRYISLWRSFCETECDVLRDGVPLYSDDDHITASAAREQVGAVIADGMGAASLRDALPN